MSSEDDDMLSLEELGNKMIMKDEKFDKMQVSAWEDDSDGIDISRRPEDPLQDAMLDAAENGNLEKIISLLDINKDLIESFDSDGYRPLHRACYGNHPKVVQYLLKNGAKIDSKTHDDWQPIHSACCWNNVECLEILINHGADINARSKSNQTPLHLVSNSSHNSPCLQLLLLHPDINPFIKNDANDTPQDIAKRTGQYYPLFEIVEPCLNFI